MGVKWTKSRFQRQSNEFALRVRAVSQIPVIKLASDGGIN